MADSGARDDSMPFIVLPHWEEQPPSLKPAPSLASVTGDTVQQIRDALRLVSKDAAQ